MTGKYYDTEFFVMMEPAFENIPKTKVTIKRTLKSSKAFRGNDGTLFIQNGGDEEIRLGDPVWHCPCCELFHGLSSDCKQGQAP